MRRFVWLLAILFIAVVAGVVIDQTPSYLLIQIGGKIIIMRLWVVVVALIILCGLCFYLTRFVRWFSELPERFKAYRLKQKIKKQRQQLTLGLNGLLLHDWQLAHEKFLTLAKLNFYPTLSLLMAACSAKKSGQDSLFYAAINKAKKSKDTTYQLTLTLVEVDDFIMQGTLKKANQILGALSKKDAQKPVVLKRLLTLQIAMENWPLAAKTLELLLAHKELGNAEYERYAGEIYVPIMQFASESKEALMASWDAIPKALKIAPCLVEAYAKELLNFAEHEQAALLLATSLQQEFNESLFSLYSLCHGKDQIIKAEKWLKSEAPSAQNEVAMARLYQHDKRYGQAKEAIERSMALGRTPDARYVLAEILLEQGDSVGALRVLSNKS